MGDLLYGHPEGEPFEMAPKLYEPVEDPNVVTSLWFKGHINRAEAEALIMGEGVPGNFLVRQKDRSKRLFAHSYLSKSLGKVVHNLIELKDDGQWLVDDKKFSGTTLDMVVDKIQTRLKQWRHLVDVDPATRKAVEASWSVVFRPKWSRADSVRYLSIHPAGWFVIRGSSTQGQMALSVRKPSGVGEDCVWNGPILESKQGHYLKFSELIGPTLVDLVASMLLNTERTLAAGIPAPLALPPPELPPEGGQTHAERKAYEVADCDDGIYDDIDNGKSGADATDFKKYDQADNVMYNDIDDASNTGRDRSDSIFKTEVNDLYGEDDDDDVPPRPPPQPEDKIVYGDLDYDDPPPPRGQRQSIVSDDFVDASVIVPPPRPAKNAPPPPAEEFLYGDPDDDTLPPPRPAKPSGGPPPRPPK